MPPPGQRRLWVGGGGQWKPLPLRSRCRRAALESETSKREPFGALCTYSGFLGLPSPKLLAKSVSASRIVCTKAKAPAEPPFPRLTVQQAALFSKLSQRTRFSQVCASAARVERPCGAALRGLRARLGAEPGRGCACPRWPFRPSLRADLGHSAPFLPPRIGLTVWDARHLHLGKHQSLSSERSVARTRLTL